MWRFFGFISHIKIANLAKKERKRTQCSFYKDKKELNVLFSIYIYIYIYIYISIYSISIYIYISIYLRFYIYLNIYIEKKN